MKTKLEEIRTKKGLSQEQVADLVGMTQPNYSRKENGFTKITNKEWLLLAKKLDVDFADIYEEEPKNVIYKNKDGYNNFNFGTITVNIPDFVLEYIELLKQENQSLKNRIHQLEKE